MTITALWMVVVGLSAYRFRPQPLRVIVGTRHSTRQPSRLFVAVGVRVHRSASFIATSLGRPRPSARTDRQLARIAQLTLGATLMLAIAPQVALATGLVGGAMFRLRRRRTITTRQALVRRQLPDVVELLAIAMGSGANLTQAIDITTANMDGVVCQALRDALAATSVGHRMVDALRMIPTQLGEEARPLVTALVLAERHGTPLVEALRQLAGDLRDQRRRHAEEVARRVPIRLLGPLVLLLLPAFALLSVAPLLASGLRSLRL